MTEKNGCAGKGIFPQPEPVLSCCKSTKNILIALIINELSMNFRVFQALNTVFLTKHNRLNISKLR